MGYKVGIIPAAGKALRFGGVIKELLRLPDGRTLLEHAVERLSHCDRIVVVSNADKVAKHIQNLEGKAGVVIQQGDEMWGAIQTAMTTYEADHYYLTMPDTWMMKDAFKGIEEYDFGYGYFITEYPERFGILTGNRFEDKPQLADIPAVAWGVLMWSKHVQQMWHKKRPMDYTEAINQALDRYNYRHWSIGPYFDCANINDYEKLLRYLGKGTDGI